jgi:diguanylate cyclase (GGDEF)-like protein/PAS domain S-box-containing protein
MGHNSSHVDGQEPAPGTPAPEGTSLAMSDVEALLEMLPDAVMVAAEDGRVVAANRQAGRLFSGPRTEMIGQPIESLMPEAFRASHQRLRDRYWSWPDARPVGVGKEVAALRRDGTTMWVEVGLSMLSCEEGKFVVASMRDVSDARRECADLDRARAKLADQLAALERENKGLRGAERVAQMLQSAVSEPEILQIVSENCARLLPQVSGTLMLRDQAGLRLTVVASWGAGHDDARPLDAKDCWAVRVAKVCGTRYPGNAPRCSHADGSGDYLCMPLLALDRCTGVLQLRPTVDGSAIDPLDEELASTLVNHGALALSNFRMRELLEAEAIRDPLSGLFNRRYMEKALQRELSHSARHRRPFCLVLLDIDHFKGFNDSYGHDAADAVLCEVARFLEENTRAEDIVCRYGGDELVLILPDTALQAGTAKAESLQAGIVGRHVSHLGQLLPSVTVKTGVSAFPRDGNDFSSLFRAADAALLRAKGVGPGGPSAFH